MAQSLNQFAQTVEQGMLDLMSNPNSISAQVDSTEAGTLVPGQAVTLVDSVNGIAKVIAAADDEVDIYGFVNYSMKQTTFVAGDVLEISAYEGNVMYMTASAAIARNAEVMIVQASKKVATAAGADKRIVGRAVDKATADGQLIRVYIKLPGAVVPA